VSRTLLLTGYIVICSLASVGAQGNGHAYGKLKHGTPSSGGASQVQPTAGVRNFGSWLDDASVMAPGSGSLSVSFGWFRSPLFREFDMPVADGGIGLTDRVQFGFSVPYYHVNEPGGPVVRGIGDLYLSAKVQLREPSASRIGVAVIPVVEVLSSDPGPGERQFQWAIPVSVEMQRTRWRAFGSAGYFSRGSVFAGGAVEAAVARRTWVTATITQSHSTADDEPGASLILSRSRTDVSGGASHAVTPRIYVFGNVGRTISRQDANAATITISGGASVSFDAWRLSTPRTR